MGPQVGYLVPGCWAVAFEGVLSGVHVGSPWNMYPEGQGPCSVNLSWKHSQAAWAFPGVPFTLRRVSLFMLKEIGLFHWGARLTAQGSLRPQQESRSVGPSVNAGMVRQSLCFARSPQQTGCWLQPSGAARESSQQANIRATQTGAGRMRDPSALPVPGNWGAARLSWEAAWQPIQMCPKSTHITRGPGEENSLSCLTVAAYTCELRSLRQEGG